MKKWILPTKSIDKEKIQYEWVAESTACEVCKGMDGVIYDSANDIPDRPHPNCKCHIEIIEKESDEPVTDPLESLKKEREEELRVKMDVQKLLGDTKSLMEEIDEYLRQVDAEELKLKEFQQIVKIEQLEVEDRQKFTQAIEKIEFAKYRGEKVKKDLTNLQTETIVLEGKVEKIRILGPILEQIIKGLEALLGAFAVIAAIVKELIIVAWEQLKKDNYATLKKVALDLAISQADKIGMEDAKGFWQFSSTKKINEYIEKNGKIYDKISDLNNNKLETIVRTKLNSQLNIKEARGVVFHNNSSVSQKIVDSDTLKNFIHGKQTLLLEKRLLQDGSLNFLSVDSPNLHNALGHTDIIDIKLDAENNLLAKIIDTYDFNKNDPNKLVQLARTLQESGLIENYYEIIEIKVPYEIWINY